MTRAALIDELVRIERLLDNRVEIWRVIIDVGPNGEPIEIGRVYRGAVNEPRDWKAPTTQKESNHED